MGLLSRLGLARASEVQQYAAHTQELRQQVASLEARVKFAKAVSSGVPITWGQFDYEQTDLMRGREKWSTIDRMENDPHVSGGLNAYRLPLIGAKWAVMPASDKPIDVEIAEFVASNLLREQSDKFGEEYWVASSWKAQRLPEILNMLPHGFALFAKSTREVNGKIVYDRLQWLEPSSIDTHGWVIDDQDNLVAVKRTFLGPQLAVAMQEPLPAARLALYSWDFKGARFPGRPFIRSAFGAWYRKDFMLRQAVIWAQKVGSPIPEGTYPPEWDPQSIRRFEEHVQSMRGQNPESAYVVTPQTTDGREAKTKYVGADTGEVDRMRGLIDGENSETAHALGQKAGMLGETDTGSRAVGMTIGKAEQQLVQAVAEIVCEWETHGVGNLPGLIEELVGWNYPNVKAFPRLSVSKITPYEGVQNVDALVKAKGAGLVPNCPELRKQTTEIFGITLPDDVYDAEPDLQVAAPAGTAPADEDTFQEDDDQQAALAMRDRLAGLLAPMEGAPSGANFRRPITVLEARYCRLEEVAETFRTGQRDVHNAMRDIRDAMIRELIGRLRAGKITRRNLEGQRRSAFRGQARAEAMLLAPIERTGREGMEHVEGELGRMGGKSNARVA